MSKFIETGHPRNVANLGKLIETVDAFGASYNPSRTALTVANLRVLETDAKAALDLVIDQVASYDDAINKRHIAFADLKRKASRIMAALKASGTTDELLDDAKGFNRKIQGQRATKPPLPTDPNASPPTTVSVSQQSFDQLIQHLKGLIAIIKTEPNYAPNETDLKVTSLDNYVADLLDKNNKVAIALAAISSARIERDKLLYKKETGLYAIAQAVKLYVRSVFGTQSPEYRQVTSITFTNKKI
ncbi:MAG: hypothetical protein JNL75_11430 [Chitinophagales bacterium]|nr:hypothetical protein [Chitinophagales bacterium]